MVGSGRLGIWLGVPLALALSCGGRSERPSGDGDAGGGGSSSAGVGGTITGGTTAYGCYYEGVHHDSGRPFLTPDGCSECWCTEGGGYFCGEQACTCWYGGHEFPNGASVPADDGCNTCTCSAGGMICTNEACPTGCTIDGRAYAHGETFTFDEPNGCGTCTCSDGDVNCATMPCPGSSRCDMLSFWYSERVSFGGKSCDPTVDLVQCNVLVSSWLPCGCSTYVNEDAMLRSWLAEWQLLGCGNDILCDPCPPPPIGGYCSVQGTCTDSY